MTATTFIHANSGVAPTSGQAVVEAQFVDGDGNPVDIGGDAPTTIPTGALSASAPLTATRDGDGVITVALPDGSVTADKLAEGVIPDAPTWADISGKPAAASAIADLADAPTAADVNKILAALRAFGVIAK